MDKRTVEGTMTEILLRQVDGASITTIRGLQYFIEIDLDNDYKVSYVYNINPNKEYFLQRVQPYPIVHGKFDDDKDLVNFITKDVEAFRNAQKSSNFENFINTTGKLQTMTGAMEEMFLQYNVEADKLIDINDELTKIMTDIEEITKTAKKIEPQK